LELVADTVAAERADNEASLDAGANTLLAVFTVDVSAFASALVLAPPPTSSGDEKAFLVRCFGFCSGGDAVATRLPELAPFNGDNRGFEDVATAEARFGPAAFRDFGAFCEALVAGRPRERDNTAEEGAAGPAHCNTIWTYERVYIAGRQKVHVLPSACFKYQILALPLSFCHADEEVYLPCLRCKPKLLGVGRAHPAQPTMALGIAPLRTRE